MTKSNHSVMAVIGFAMFAASPATIAEEKPVAGEVAKAEWINLLQDDSLALWERGPSNAKNPSKEVGDLWSLEDGVLLLDKEKKGRGGHIVTKKSYFDFEMKFEFKVSKNGNSGVKYRTTDGLGLEFQVLDDELHRDNKNPTHRSASLYELVAAPDTKTLHPAGGEWNKARIVAKGNLLEHWLNGEKVVSIEFGSDDWKERFAKSKYIKHPGFAEKAGPLLLQDHGDTVSYRNVFVRDLK
ncbi:3-keto-disaccharide hydrolase [Haloferula sp.]|uniref:3-keto-disaccharide hydrolase n=1 Tax=Haloferula sp. TaxID=2497595 RepID=UPI00329F98AC